MNRTSESGLSFSLMVFTLKIASLFGLRKRDLREFGVSRGKAVMDYGCGPGMYFEQASELVGEKGKVFAVEIHPLATKSVETLIEKRRLKNVSPVLADVSSCPLPDACVDLIYAMDMFHNVEDHMSFLKELRRLLSTEGRLILEDGHQKREETLRKIIESKVWRIAEERPRYVKCIPLDG